MQANNRIPPLICRICRPHIGFWRYSVFRAHIRAQHQIKNITNANLRQFETYPGSSAQVIRDPVPNYQAPVQPTPPPAANPNVQAPPQNVPNQNAQVPMPLPQNVPIQNAPAPTPPPQPAAAVNAQAVDDNNQVQNDAEGAAGGGNQGAAQNELALSPSFTVGQIQNLIWLEMDKVLKKRLPSLGTEIQLRVDQAVGNAMAVVVPELVGDILIEAANRYADDETNGRRSLEQAPSSDRTIERSGLNLRVSLNNSNDKTAEAAQTESDEELMAISPSIADGTFAEAKSSTLVSFY